MTDTSIRNRLFLMMVLEIAIWGAWQIKIFPYMGMLEFTPNQIAAVGSVFGIASLLGMFFSNQFADRNFAAEKFLAFSHCVGGLALLWVAWTLVFRKVKLVAGGIAAVGVLMVVVVVVVLALAIAQLA